MQNKPRFELPIHRVTDNPNDSHCLPSDYYTNLSIFEAEIERVFCRSWIYAGHISKLQKKGDYITADISGENILIIREDDSTISAYYNVCQHRAHTLLEGEGRAMAITCPAHSWSYGLNGNLRSGPGLNEIENFDLKNICLNKVRVEEFCGLVFVNLDEDSKTLESQVSGLKEKILSYVPHPEKLVRAYRSTSVRKTNWKCVIDNYLECYHCKTTHKRFCELVDMDGYKTTPHGAWSWHQGPGFSTDTTRNPDTNGGFAGVHLWPNMTINFFPGRNNELMIFMAVPIAPDRTMDIFEFYLESEEINEETKAEIDWIVNVLTEEDMVLCEKVQEGLKSRGYKDGRLVVNTARNYLSEHSLHGFHRMVIEHLEKD